ncbi:NAD(P)/FAD-dependent oxidoreductase [Marinobacter sp. Arc7-DN-1]|uniref:NAD(P)/FAD-dependent oxidoreductase n=1 Tax=Marinobacter sp. Arc7-DN-1 TaxID=2304594 RepID=UPI001D0D87A4|nr:FAD-dependent oxidoreductase [Marinobacter sp. Arc7-DN-1]
MKVMTKQSESTLVICGHGMVSQRLLEALCREPGRPFTRIVVFNGETTPAYNRIQLSSLLAGGTDERSLALQPGDWFRDNAIEVHDGEPVTAINRQDRTVATATGRVQSYTHLVLATGSRPAKPGVPGEDLPGVMTFRDLDDTRVLIETTRRHRRAVVIGGGFLGLEAAEGLRQRGMAVTLLHRSGHLLNRQLDAVGGHLLQQHMEDRGLSIRTKASPRALLGRHQIRAVQLEDETLISTDLVVIAAGISPSIGLARDAGLACDRGILVDGRLRTTDPAISALGECCQLGDTTFGLVEPGYQQAEVLAGVLNGSTPEAEYRPVDTPTRLKISGVPIFSCGQVSAGPDTESVVWQDHEQNHYCRLLIKNQRLTGAVLLGDTRDGPWYSQRILQQDDISRYRDHIAFGKNYCEAAA